MWGKVANSLGFTLIELMVTISIAAILLSMAIPSFVSTIQSNNLTTHTNELISALNLARSEAIKRGVQVTLARKSDTATVWEAGWDVFVDKDGDESFADADPANPCETNADDSPAEDCLLKTYDALPDGYTIRTSDDTDYQNYAVYLPTGFAKIAAEEIFRLCDSSGDETKSRAIHINTLGRVRVEEGTDSCP